MKGTVYKIEVGEDIYVGSTINRLSGRQAIHNKDYKKNVNKCKLYEECRKYEIDKIVCVPLEIKEVENELEMKQLEQEYIDKLNPSLNSYSAYSGLTKKEYSKKYREDNIEKITQYQKQYQEDNKEKLTQQKKIYNKEYNIINKEKNKERRENSKDYFKKYREDNKHYYKQYNKQYNEDNKETLKEKKKEYIEKNKEKIRQQQKEYGKTYREINKEKIKEQKKQNITCPICGFVGRKEKLTTHQKSKKCLSMK